MVDEQIKEYIHNLLKKNYDIDHIKQTLTKAGHDVEKIDNLSSHVFKEFHGDLLTYLNAEVAKGRDLNEIKKELLTLGHSENKIKHLLYHHHASKQQNSHHLIDLIRNIHIKKPGYSEWNIVLVGIFFMLSVIFLILAFMTDETVPVEVDETLSVEERFSRCDQIKDSTDELADYYHTICLGVLNANLSVCGDLTEQVTRERCADTINHYLYFHLNDTSYCDAVNNINVQEYCYEISGDECSPLMALKGYCTAVISDDVSVCTNETSIEKYPTIVDCTTNYYIVKGIKEGSDACDEISDDVLSYFCEAISKT